MKRAVLDTGALIAMYENEPGGKKVEDLIHQAREGRYSLYMSVVNWGEVYYVTWNGRGPGVARRVVDEISRLPIEITAADVGQTSFAAELKAEHKLPYADCFAASLAIQRQATLVTTDGDFNVLKKKLRIQLLP